MHTGPLQTYRGYVNTWECDDRGHLNVQFYPDRFADAASHALNLLGFGPAAARRAGAVVRLLDEHVTLQRELRASDNLTVMSGVVGIDARGITLFHELIESTGGNIASTSVQHFAIEGGTLPGEAITRAQAAIVEVPAHGRARSVGRIEPPDLVLDAPGTENLIEIRRGIVHPDGFDASGQLRARFVMAQFSDGAGHLWEAFGMPRDKMVDRDLGSVVVEMMLRFLRPIAPGTLVVARSGVRGMSGKVLSVNHFLFDAETGLALVTADVTALMMDLNTRRAVAMPADVAACASRHLLPGVVLGT